MWNSCSAIFLLTCGFICVTPSVQNKFFLVSGQRGYDNLLALCKKEGGLLAKIENAKDQEAAQEIVRGATSNVVIDGRRSSAEPSEFVNANGKRLPYVNWNIGEPNHLSEQCIMMYWRGSHAFGKWNDFSCKNLNTALCEKNAVGCEKKTCEGGFLGKDCRCWCKGPDINNYLVYCGTNDPVQLVIGNPHLKDLDFYCKTWANRGYCRIYTYVKERCLLSCYYALN